MKFTKKTNSKDLKKISKALPITNSHLYQKEGTLIQKKFSHLNISSADWLKEIVEGENIVRVKWKDAQSTGGPGWEIAEDIKDAAIADICIVHTVGYVLNYTDERIVVTDTIQSDGDSGGAVHLIPMEMVQEIQWLTPKEDTNVQSNNRNKLGTQNGGTS